MRNAIQCAFCEHFRSPLDVGDGTGEPTCTAFPLGIPDPIWLGDADHREPYSGDGGIRWTALDGAKFPEYALSVEEKAFVPTEPDRVFLEQMRAKHGTHDQRTHGRHSAANRARQAAEELEELREALGRAQASTSNSDARWITPDDAMAMRDKMLAGHPWSPEQREALNRYVGDSYYGMNGLLRGDAEAIADLDERQKQEATDLIRDAAQGMRPTTEPVKVKRFVGGFATFGLDIDTMTREEIYDAMRGMKGSTLQEPGFMSTSLLEDYGKDTWSGKVKLELDVPEGAQGAYLDGDVGFPTEHELLLAPGSRFEILDVVIDPPRNTVKGRVIVE